MANTDLEHYNKLLNTLRRPDFRLELNSSKTRRLLQIISQRNEIILQTNQIPTIRSLTYRNECEPLTSKTTINPNHMAFHSGPKMQIALTSKSRKFKNLQKLEEVYFTIKPQDIFQYLETYTEDNEDLVYVVDLSKAQNTLTQTDYQSRVLWEDKLRTLIQLYEDNKENTSINKISFEPHSNEHEYTKDVAGKKKQKLEDAIRIELTDWKLKHTIPFNLNRLNRYHARNLDYVLVEGPIKVNY